MPLAEVDQMCRAHIVIDTPIDHPIEACVIFENATGLLTWDERERAERCLIFYAEEMPTPRDVDETMQHEMAHCRGWPPSHPGMTL